MSARRNYEAGGASAQDHIEPPEDGFVSYNNLVDAVVYAKEVPKTRAEQGYPDIYINHDVTIQVDPEDTAHWLRDDTHVWRNAATKHRAARIQHKGVERTIALLDKHAAPHVTFVPTVAHFERGPISMSLYSTSCTANSTRGYTGHPASENYGKLPCFSKQNYYNAFGTERKPDKPDWRVWRDMWFENTHGDRNRAFDCDGMCR